MSARDNLETYLNDHLAGANGALRHLRSLIDHAPDETLRKTLTGLLQEIEGERDELTRIMNELGISRQRLRIALALVARALSRVKFRFTSGDQLGLSHLHAIDALSAGIAGKRSLWESMDAAGFETADWRALKEQASSQVDRLRDQRRRIAPRILGNENPTD